MSLTNRQEQIIYDIVHDNSATANERYLKAGQQNFGISDATQASNTARTVDEEGLTRIADQSLWNSDVNVLKQIALWTMNDPNKNLDRTILFFTLAHRSMFTFPDDDPNEHSNQICCLGNQTTYLDSIVDNAQGIQTLTPEYAKLNEMQKVDNVQVNSKINFYTDPNSSSKKMFYVGENNVIMGKSKSWSYSTNTAACVVSKAFSEPIVYKGYCFETAKGRTSYASGGSVSTQQAFFLTPGGGPLNSTNWIIKLVEYGRRTIRFDYDTNTQLTSPWVLDDPNNENIKRSIVKIYIHFFFPDGAYVRTILDRSDSADFTGATSSAYGDNWIYRDYSNAIANTRNLTFKKVWNEYIINKYYRPVGGYNPSVIDISSNWNGDVPLSRLDVPNLAALQQRQVAYQASNVAVKWEGGGEHP